MSSINKQEHLYNAKDIKSDEYNHLLDILFSDTEIRKAAQEKLYKLSFPEEVKDKSHVSKVLDNLAAEENIHISTEEKNKILSEIEKDVF